MPLSLNLSTRSWGWIGGNTVAACALLACLPWLPFCLAGCLAWLALFLLCCPALPSSCIALAALPCPFCSLPCPIGFELTLLGRSLLLPSPCWCPAASNCCGLPPSLHSCLHLQLKPCMPYARLCVQHNTERSACFSPACCRSGSSALAPQPPGGKAAAACEAQIRRPLLARLAPAAVGRHAAQGSLPAVHPVGLPGVC